MRSKHTAQHQNTQHKSSKKEETTGGQKREAGCKEWLELMLVGRNTFGKASLDLISQKLLLYFLFPLTAYLLKLTPITLRAKI